jgi:hypothetical protein
MYYPSILRVCLQVLSEKNKIALYPKDPEKEPFGSAMIDRSESAQATEFFTMRGSVRAHTDTTTRLPSR